LRVGGEYARHVDPFAARPIDANAPWHDSPGDARRESWSFAPDSLPMSTSGQGVGNANTPILITRHTVVFLARSVPNLIYPGRCPARSQTRD